MVAHRLVRRLVPVLLIVFAVAALAWAFGSWWLRAKLTDEEIRQVAFTTIQREAPASFFITGYLEMTSTITARSSKVLFPDVFNVDLGTTSSTVRVPGRVSYGFDVTQLTPESIRVTEEGVIEVSLPELHIYSVEPDLNAMQVQTSVGWARRHAGSGRQMEQKAIRFVETSLRRQGRQYLEQNTQPRINTARAMEKLLTPALTAAGLERPVFRFRIAPEIVLTPGG